MEGNFVIDNDNDLQLLLSEVLPKALTMKIASRVFCEVPVADFYAEIPTELGGDGTTKYDDLFKAFYEDDTTVYILVGEHTDAYGSTCSGSRNLTDNAMYADEILVWVDYFGVEKFHVDFPRVEVEEV